MTLRPIKTIFLGFLFQLKILSAKIISRGTGMSHETIDILTSKLTYYEFLPKINQFEDKISIVLSEMLVLRQIILTRNILAVNKHQFKKSLNQ